MTIPVDLGGPLHPRDLLAARGPLTVEITAAVRARMATSRAFLDQALGDDRAVYGATTGFGALVGYAGRPDQRDQADNTLAHLGAGQGPDLDPALVRAALLVRAWSLAQGASGASPHVVEALAAMLATSFTPAVPRFGSVGASGDLIPLGAAAQSLRGRGHAYLAIAATQIDGQPSLADPAADAAPANTHNASTRNDEPAIDAWAENLDDAFSGAESSSTMHERYQRLPAGEALRLAGLAPLALDGRDALAFVNGTSLTTAALALALDSVRRSHRSAQLLTCLLADQLGCDPQFLDERLIGRFHHAGASAVAATMRATLRGSIPSGNRPLQEPYSIRCSPQLLGAAEDALRYVDGIVAADLGGVSDNPLLFPADDAVVHGGNFFGQPAGFAADLLAIVLAQVGNLVERQLDLLVDPHRNNGLPPMLAAGPGRQHGLQGVQLATTALIAEIRRDATPASMQSLPTNLHNQDVVPFGTQAALRALDQAALLRLLCGSLALGLRQAAHVGARRPTAPGCARLLDALVDAVPPIDPDRPLEAEVRRSAQIVEDIEISLISGS